MGLCRFGCVIAHVALLAFALAGHAQRPPAAEHHAHLQSPEAARLLSSSSKPEDEAEEPHTARDLIAALDAADVHESVALSDAYRFGAPWLHLPDEAAAVDRENAWTAAQAAQYPARLVAFCSVNPLKPYAEAAIRRCHALGMRGLKLHLANAGFHFDHAQDVRALAGVFRLANHYSMAILIHVRNAVQWDAALAMRCFVEEVLPNAPDVVVQIAHVSGWGGYDRATDAGFSALLDRCADRPSVCRRVYFDLAVVVLPASAASAKAGSDFRMLADGQAGFAEGPRRLAANLRRAGLDRVLFATDWPDIAPAAYADLLRTELPLEPRELDQLLGNRAPYFAALPDRRKQ